MQAIVTLQPYKTGVKNELNFLLEMNNFYLLIGVFS
jgi:hypothetical protein